MCGCLRRCECIAIAAVFEDRAVSIVIMIVIMNVNNITVMMTTPTLSLQLLLLLLTGTRTVSAAAGASTSAGCTWRTRRTWTACSAHCTALADGVQLSSRCGKRSVAKTVASFEPATAASSVTSDIAVGIAISVLVLVKTEHRAAVILCLCLCTNCC